MGAGGVGLMGMALTRAMYGAPYVADIDPKKREAALAAGAKQVFDPADPDTRKAVLKASGGVYAAVDFAGSDKSLNFATSVLAKGGKEIPPCRSTSPTRSSMTKPKPANGWKWRAGPTA